MILSSVLMLYLGHHSVTNIVIPVVRTTTPGKSLLYRDLYLRDAII
jgi:hypothetical protein